MKPTRTLIVIADAARARFFTHDRPHTQLSPLAGAEMSTDIPPGHDIMADRPGRAFSSAGSRRSAMEPKSDPRELVERDFARTVIDKLEKNFAETRADRLVIVAAPKTLAEMRKHLPPALDKHLAATLDKDLTKIPEQELMGHLGEMLGV
jgi:protein required for attachment to host cells